jgi:hypothetical protein
LLSQEDDGEEEKMTNCLSIQKEGKLWTSISYKGQGMKSRRARQHLLLRLTLPASSRSAACYVREFPDIIGSREVHHHLVAFLYGELLREFHMSASACSPSCSFSYLYPERLLLVFPPAVVAEAMFPRPGCVFFSTPPQAFFIVLLS